MYHGHIISDHFLNFSTNFTEKERDDLLRINVSLFEAIEVLDTMNTQTTPQHLCTKFTRVSLYTSTMHWTCVFVQLLEQCCFRGFCTGNPTRNTGVLQIKIKKTQTTAF